MEQIGGPVSEIEEQKHEREGDTRDEVDPGGAFRSAGEPTFRQKAPAAPRLGRRRRRRRRRRHRYRKSLKTAAYAVVVVRRDRADGDRRGGR